MEKSRINLLKSRIYELEDAFFRGEEIDLKDFDSVATMNDK